MLPRHVYGFLKGAQLVSIFKPNLEIQEMMRFRIGCDVCDGGESNPNYRDRCNSRMRPTNNNPYFRTVNQNATAMSKADVYQHNPWRSPGSSSVNANHFVL